MPSKVQTAKDRHGKTWVTALITLAEKFADKQPAVTVMSIITTAKKEKRTQTRTIRLEIAKPMNMTWDALGELLRAQRHVMHRLMNAAVLDTWMAQEYDVMPNVTSAIHNELARIKETTKWEAIKTMNLPSVIVDALGIQAQNAVVRYYKDQNNELPNFGGGQPIYVRDRGWSIREEARPVGEDGKSRGKQVVLSVKLHGGNAEPYAELLVRAHNGAHWAEVRRLCYMDDSVTWHDNDCRRVDDGSNPHLCQYFASATIAGQRTEDTVTLDLRDGSELAQSYLFRVVPPRKPRKTAKKAQSAEQSDLTPSDTDLPKRETEKQSESESGVRDISLPVLAPRKGGTENLERARGDIEKRCRLAARTKVLENREYKLGQCQIVYDERARRKDGSHGKWFILVSYTVPRVAPVTAKHTMVVHRGMYNFLYFACSDGHAGHIVRGNDLQDQREKLRMQLRSIKSGHWTRGSGALGRGKKRRYKPYRAKEDQIKNLTRTWCQTAAAAVIRIAKKFGVGTIVVEDYDGIAPSENKGIRRFVDRFPMYQLKSSIVWACEKAGLTVQETPSLHISRECPCCSHTEPANVRRSRTGQIDLFLCRYCGYERPVDWVSSLHLLRRSGADMSVWSARFEEARRLAEGKDEDAAE